VIYGSCRKKRVTARTGNEAPEQLGILTEPG
jgi:hypothetical protein